MCWNAAVSLNTFLFSSFVLGLVIYNNAYTQYKIQELNNTWVYIFFMLFISIQLLEFFIWRNINNPYYNHVFSSIINGVFVSFPIATGMIISDINFRNGLLIAYGIFLLYTFLFNINITEIYTTISKYNHLQYHFMVKGYPYVHIWIFFFLFPFFYIGKFWSFLFGIVTLFISIYYFQLDQSIGSMWCWIANIIHIFLAIYLLVVLPFLENGKLKDFC